MTRLLNKFKKPCFWSKKKKLIKKDFLHLIKKPIFQIKTFLTFAPKNNFPNEKVYYTCPK